MGNIDRRPVVLVVDDETDVRAVFSRMLEFGGYAPVEAATGEAALDLLATGLTPAAVLLDLRMPGMGGLGFLARLRADADNGNLPVAVITGDSFIDDTLESTMRALDAAIYYKPVNIDDILALTTRLVSRGASRRVHG